MGQGVHYKFRGGSAEQGMPAAPQQAPAAAPMPTPQFGQRGFNFDRALPGGAGIGTSARINPITGMPYANYQEWAQVNMPEMFAASKFGQGLQPAPAAPQPMGMMARPKMTPYPDVFGGGGPQADPALVSQISNPYGFRR